MNRLLLSSLEADWLRLRHDRQALTRARSWELVRVPIDSLDDVLELTGYGRVGRCSADHDAAFVSLLELARDDELAARVLLQRILPGLWSMTRRRCRAADPRLGAFAADDGEVVSTAWTVIRRFPTARRDHVAPRLLGEIEYRVYRRPYRRAARFEATPLDELDIHAAQLCPSHDDPLERSTFVLEVVLGTAERRGLSVDDAEVLRRWGAGEPAADIAVEADVTERTVRNRRNAALERVRRLVAEPQLSTAAAVAAAHGGAQACLAMSSVSQTR